VLPPRAGIAVLSSTHTKAGKPCGHDVGFLMSFMVRYWAKKAPSATSGILSPNQSVPQVDHQARDARR